MAKSKNLVIRCESTEEVKKWVDEYAFIGREVAADYDKLEVTVLTVPSEYKAKKEKASKLANKREEYDVDLWE